MCRRNCLMPRFHESVLIKRKHFILPWITYSKFKMQSDLMVRPDLLSSKLEWKIRAVSKDRQSTVTSPPTTLNQLCLKGDIPSNLSWKPVLELSFIPIRTSSSAHWAECFPAIGGNNEISKIYISILLIFIMIWNICLQKNCVYYCNSIVYL